METPGNDEPSPNGEPGAGADPDPLVSTTPPTPSPSTPPPTPPPTAPSGPALADDDDPDDESAAVRALDEVETIFEGGLEGDWPARAADAIVNVVGAVRDNTTGRVTTIARAVVFGFFAVVLGLAVAVMLIIAAIRLLDEALPSGVWLAYLVLGVVMVVAGALVFRKRKEPAPVNGNTGRL